MISKINLHFQILFEMHLWIEEEKSPQKSPNLNMVSTQDFPSSILFEIHL